LIAGLNKYGLLHRSALAFQGVINLMTFGIKAIVDLSYVSPNE
jgi:hypothetical protein